MAAVAGFEAATVAGLGASATGGRVWQAAVVGFEASATGGRVWQAAVVGFEASATAGGRVWQQWLGLRLQLLGVVCGSTL